MKDEEKLWIATDGAGRKYTVKGWHPEVSYEGSQGERPVVKAEGKMLLTLKLKFHTYPERLWMWFVWKLPRRLIYFAAIRLWAHGTTGKYGTTNAGDLTVDEAVKRWEGKG